MSWANVVAHVDWTCNDTTTIMKQCIICIVVAVRWVRDWWVVDIVDVIRTNIVKLTIVVIRCVAFIPTDLRKNTTAYVVKVYRTTSSTYSGILWMLFLQQASLLSMNLLCCKGKKYFFLLLKWFFFSFFAFSLKKKKHNDKESEKATTNSIEEIVSAFKWSEARACSRVQRAVWELDVH